MTRRTRPERDVWEARIAFTRQGFASFTRSLVEVVILAGIAGGLTQVITDDLKAVLSGAGWAALATIAAALAIAAVLVVAWLTTRNEEQRAGDGETLGRVTDNWWLAAAEGWTWEEQRRYLVAVREGEAGFSQDSAAEFAGKDRDTFNNLLRRCVNLGFYVTNNPGRYDHRNQGTWTEEGQTMLNELNEEGER